MIHTIPGTSPVGSVPLATLGEDFNYSKVIVKKPWGYEYLVFENEYVAIWMLHIVRKRKTSTHCHPNKKTGLILLHGSATFYNDQGSIALNSMDGVVIGEGAFHCTEASSPFPIVPISENGIWVMEIESPPMKDDLVRKSDAYGRAGTSYEGKDKWVFDPKEILQLENIPDEGVALKKTLHDTVFVVRRGSFTGNGEPPAPDGVVSAIGKGSGTGSSNPFLAIGGLVTYREFSKHVSDEEMRGVLTLTIERPTTLKKVTDYMMDCVADLGVTDVFAVCGGGAMHLVDSLGKHERLNYVATHHEQAAAMAAEGYARISGKPGVALVTSGPGGTNAITGVCGAWIDSIPTIFISGQVTTDTLIKDTGLRQFGIQESNITELVAPITKYAVTVTDPATIRYHMEKAIYIATHGRPGPVWLDIPLDVQSKVVNISEQRRFDPSELTPECENEGLQEKVSQTIEMLKTSKRPVLISGYGIRLAGAEKEFVQLVERLGIPVISSWTSSDLLPTAHEHYVGRSGIMGDRGGNFAVQNSDLLLIVGSRMSIPQVGYNYKTFAREAKKIMVDISTIELAKPTLSLDLAVHVDAKVFIAECLRQLEGQGAALDIPEWRERTRSWKKTYPVVLAEYKDNKDGVNSFYFVDLLSEKLGNDAVVVTDMGTSFTCTMQTFKSKGGGQRLFTSSGHASMGFGLPGAIGACYGHGKKKTICIAGDGALQMNIQELQTMVHYKLPIILFVLNNNGYLTIKLMQQNHFGRYVGSDPGSGLSFPDIVKVATAYGIKSERIENQHELNEKIDSILAEPGPFVCEIVMPEDQPLIPRVSSLKMADGTIVSKPLEDLYPFLSRDEFRKNMIVKPIEILEE